MNDLRLFENEEFSIRVIEQDGEPWWIAKDICEILGLGNVSQAVSRLDEDERLSFEMIASPGGAQDTTIISEPGLYSLILSSRKPEAKKFSRWVRHEVLPTIRKTGGYGVQHFASLLTPQRSVDEILRVGKQLTAHEEIPWMIIRKLDEISSMLQVTSSIARECPPLKVLTRGDVKKIQAKRGRSHYAPPAENDDLPEQDITREEATYLFVYDACMTGPEKVCRAMSFRIHYANWMHLRGFKPLNRPGFEAAIRRICPELRKVNIPLSTITVKGWEGIEIKPSRDWTSYPEED